MRSTKAHQHHRYPRLSENSAGYRNGQLVWTALVACSLAAAALHHAATSSRPAVALARGVPDRSLANRSLSAVPSQSQAQYFAPSQLPGELPARRMIYYPR